MKSSARGLPTGRECHAQDSQNWLRRVKSQAFVTGSALPIGQQCRNVTWAEKLVAQSSMWTSCAAMVLAGRPCETVETTNTASIAHDMIVVDVRKKNWQHPGVAFPKYSCEDHFGTIKLQSWACHHLSQEKSEEVFT